jgi:hypothetical protein
MTTAFGVLVGMAVAVAITFSFYAAMVLGLRFDRWLSQRHANKRKGWVA